MSQTQDDPANGSARWADDPLAIDRAQGCLLGQLAGDALGALVEFASKQQIRCLYPQGLRDLAAGGPWNIVAGQPTDDSEMALTLARTLVRDRAYRAEAVFKAYIRWCASDPFDIGATTSAALRTPFRDRHRTGESQANGSLMRVSPIGIFAAGDPERAATLARIDSALTHPHPVCVSACAAYAAALAVGIAGGTRDAMREAACEQAEEGEHAGVVRTTLEAAVTRPPHEFQHQMGWALIALQNAFHHLAAGHGMAHAVSTTVMQGGDTDTNGAIVGALIGAADGHAAAPDQWKRTLASCRPCREPGVAHPRPPEYWPCDYEELARQLLTASVENAPRGP